MNLTIFLHQGPADGEILTLYRDEVPLDLRVAVNADREDELPHVEVYRVWSTDDMDAIPLVAASYVWQGSRPSAWSLVDVEVER